MDHHYVFPTDGGDLLGAEIEAARAVGMRFLPTRGSMDLGQSRGGLPPDNVVQELDAILEDTRQRSPSTTTPVPTRCSGSASLRARRSRSPQSCWWSRPRWPVSSAYVCTPIWPRPRTKMPTAASGSRCRRWTTSPPWVGSLTMSGSRTGSTSTMPASLRSPRVARVWRTALPPTRGWARGCAG